MKNNSKLILSILSLALIGLFGCSDDLIVVADSKTSPVVYCILNPADSIHFLRIGRSYIEYGDPRLQPPHFDSLVYHEDFYAYLSENKQEQQGDIFYFEPTDINKRDSGFFFSENLEVLQVKCHLKVGSEYSLYVYSPELPDLIVGTTIVIPSVTILDPVYMPEREVTILPNQGYDLRWSHPARYAVYQPVVRINYREGDEEFQRHKSLEFKLPAVFSFSDALMITDYVNGINFYNNILNRLTTPPVGIKRKIIGFDLDIWAGGEELALFIQAEGENNTPITSVGSYSNLDGAAGIFSSKVYSSSNNNRFSDITINYLAQSEETAHLGFLAFGEEF